MLTKIDGRRTERTGPAVPTPSWPNLVQRPRGSQRVYAICFDLDTAAMQNLYHAASWQNGYQDIARVLALASIGSREASISATTPSIRFAACWPYRMLLATARGFLRWSRTCGC